MVNWPWKRNKSEAQDNVPEEIQNYYQAEQRERTGVAWALALATLIVTILLALGLFYGGRWAWRAVFDNDDDGQSTSQQEEQSAENSPATSNDSNEGQSTDSEQPASLPGDDTSPENGSGQDTQQESLQSPTRTPNTGPSLPETGPSDNL